MIILLKKKYINKEEYSKNFNKKYELNYNKKEQLNTFNKVENYNNEKNCNLDINK